MAIAALDLGSRRIGVAVTDGAGLSAHPLCVLERRSPSADFEALRRALSNRDIECIVVGLPVNMDGSEGPMARHARKFAQRVGQALAIPVEFQDERLSSFEAKDRLAEVARRGRKKRPIDAVAAVVILESWLKAKRPNP